MRMKTMIATLAATIAIAGAAPAAADDDTARVKTGDKPEIGSYLTDSEGRSLYVFTIDSKDSSSCYGACAGTWPPLLTAEAPKAADDAVGNGLLGTVKRLDGGQQVTYDGRPLYRFARDRSAGEIAGQLVGGYGGKWFLVAPDGSLIKTGAATN